MINKRIIVQFARMIRSQRKEVKFLSSGNSTDYFYNGRLNQISIFVILLSDIFTSDNPNFNNYKFIAACEIDTESEKL